MNFNNNHELIEAWDANEIISTIEMGGISPGYEQAIQVGIFETIREVINSPSLQARFNVAIDENATEEEKKKYGEVLEDGLRVAMDKYGKCLEGLSGAQAGAIKSAAGIFLQYGHKNGLSRAKEQGIDKDRFILVRKEFPN